MFQPHRHDHQAQHSSYKVLYDLSTLRSHNYEQHSKMLNFLRRFYIIWLFALCFKCEHYVYVMSAYSHPHTLVSHSWSGTILSDSYWQSSGVAKGLRLHGFHSFPFRFHVTINQNTANCLGQCAKRTQIECVECNNRKVAVPSLARSTVFFIILSLFLSLSFFLFLCLQN